jgi:hypothetical protein
MICTKPPSRNKSSFKTMVQKNPFCGQKELIFGTGKLLFLASL